MHAHECFVTIVNRNPNVVPYTVLFFFATDYINGVVAFVAVIVAEESSVIFSNSWLEKIDWIILPHSCRNMEFVGGHVTNIAC